jgi:hypothetical protein
MMAVTSEIAACQILESEWHCRIGKVTYKPIDIARFARLPKISGYIGK